MKTYIVELVCTVRKSVTCQCETEAQALTDPFGHAIEELEIDQMDWEVRSVKEDKTNAN